MACPFFILYIFLSLYITAKQIATEKRNLAVFVLFFAVAARRISTVAAARQMTVRLCDRAIRIGAYHVFFVFPVVHISVYAKAERAVPDGRRKRLTARRKYGMIRKTFL